MRLEKFGKYELITKIAMGGMAEVFKAKITGEKGFEKLLVIKKVLPNLAAEDKWIEHFIDEAKLAALLNHENITHIYDFGSIDGSWFIAMEYLSGRDLKHVVTKGTEIDQPLSVENSLYIMSKVCEGLEYAHNLTDLKGAPLNIIHRDISPQNIFITFDGNVKIIDFGIAKTSAQSSQTRAGVIKGKLAYMAPEQAGGKPIDHRIDIFSAGIILYELLTGNRMFSGDVSDMLFKVISADYEDPKIVLENYPPKLHEILNKALSKNRDDRYFSAGDMRADIEDCMFEMQLRPGSRKLADYMRTVFTKEYTEEKFESLTTLDMESEDSPHKDDDYLKTAVLPRADDEKESLSSNASVFQNRMSVIRSIPGKISEKMAAVDYRKYLHVDRSKKIALIITVILICGVALIWTRHRHNESRIKDLLVLAEQRYSEDRLTKPEENCAYYYYHEVLNIDSDQPDAQEGLERIVARCIEDAEKNLRMFRHDTAMNYIEAGLKIDPDNERLLELKTKATTRVPDRLLKGIRTFFGTDDKQAEE